LRRFRSAATDSETPGKQSVSKGTKTVRHRKNDLRKPDREKEVTQEWELNDKAPLTLLEEKMGS